jgi:hypothetical protein
MKTRRPRPAQASVDLFTLMPAPVKLTTAERTARRRLSQTRTSRRAPGFDPLELRLGQRVQNRQQRPGYAVSNPRHHKVLLENPQLDDSLPGTAWLRSVYYGRDREIFALQSSRQAVDARQAQHDAMIAQQSAPLRARREPQPVDLFVQGAAL